MQCTKGLQQRKLFLSYTIMPLKVDLFPLSWVIHFVLFYIFLIRPRLGTILLCSVVKLKIYLLKCFCLLKFDIFQAPFQSIEKDKEERERIKDDNFVRCYESQYCNYSCRAFAFIIFLFRNFPFQFLLRVLLF